MKKALQFLLVTLFLMIPAFARAQGCDGAGNCYIRAGASGSGNGSSWTNAYTGFGSGSGKVSAGSMTRGVTYWIAAGSYGSVNFSTPASGTSIITVEAATVANHGPDSTWSDSYAGTASFGGDSAISTGYWTINGQSWSGSSCTGLSACGVDSAYTIYFHNTTDNQGDALSVGPGTNFTIEYVDLGGPYTISQWSTNPSTNYGDDALVTPGGSPTNNLYVGYSYLHDVGVDLVGSNNQTSSTQTNGSGHTYEHDWFARNWYTCTSTTCNHTQAMSECVTNFVVRYNVFFDIVEDGVIDINTVDDCPIGNWAIYGNTIEWDSNIPSIRQANVGGFLGFYGQTIASGQYVSVYNNTYANVGGTQSGANVNPAWIYYVGTVGSTSSGTVTIYNNLFWQTGNNNGSGKAVDVICDGSCSGFSYTADYNQGYCPSSGCTNGAGYTPSGSHDLSVSTGNPFVNFDGTSNFNVSLASDTSTGLSVPSWSTTPSGCTANVNCMNVDPLGVVRGVNGTIDRGAFQVGGTAQIPAPPGTLSVTSVE